MLITRPMAQCGSLFKPKGGKELNVSGSNHKELLISCLTLHCLKMWCNIFFLILDYGYVRKNKTNQKILMSPHRNIHHIKDTSQLTKHLFKFQYPKPLTWLDKFSFYSWSQLQSIRHLGNGLKPSNERNSLE